MLIHGGVFCANSHKILEAVTLNMPKLFNVVVRQCRATMRYRDWLQNPKVVFMECQKLYALPEDHTSARPADTPNIYIYTYKISHIYMYTYIYI